MAFAARAQQLAVPVIGYLGAQSAHEDYQIVTVSFLQGLKETGYVVGQNVAIEYRFAENRQGCMHYQLIPTMQESRLRPLMEKFAQLMLEQPLFADIYGLI